MITPPIIRVETPQLVVCASSSSPPAFWNRMFCAVEKVVPRKWLVPAWSALPSCIIASML
jgi:hypothetical protein